MPSECTRSEVAVCLAAWYPASSSSTLGLVGSVTKVEAEQLGWKGSRVHVESESVVVDTCRMLLLAVMMKG